MKLETRNKKISNYIYNNELKLEDVINDFYNYVNTIIINSNMLISNEDKEEIIFDVFFAVWKNLKKLDINKNMDVYISGITKNLIKRKYRDLKINYNIDDYEENLISSSNIELYLIENERRKFIIDKIKKFKKIDEEIFLQYYYEEKSIKEIAEFHNISQSRVKTKLFRLRIKLKKLLKNGGEF